MTILIVDNERDLAELFSGSLRAAGFEPTTVASGYEAIDRISQGGIDFVVTDYHMDHGDGISLAHFCANHNLPCMVVTGFRPEAVEPYLPGNTKVYDKADMVDEASFVQTVRKHLAEGAAGNLDVEHSIRVLLVDDDPAEFHLLQRIFRHFDKHNYQFEWTNDLDSAHRMMIENQFDAYLLDFRLGAKTGLEVLRHARQGGCCRPVILFTGMGNSDTGMRAMHSGADDYLDKANMTPERLDQVLCYAIERKRKERLVTDQQVKLTNSMKLSALGEMAMAIAHEIKNPVAVISGRTQLLKMMLKKENVDLSKVAQEIDKIEQTNQKVVQIIQSMQNHYVRAGNAKVEEVNLTSLLEECISMCRMKAKYEGVQLQLEGMESTLSYRCVASEISQLVSNLVSNGIDAAQGLPEKWVKVSAWATECEVVITVTDSGQGIPLDVRNRILKPFFTTKQNGKGSGFGLSFATKLAEKYGGRIEIDAQCPNTRFVVRLARRRENLDVSQKKLTILLVDDSPDIVDLLAAEIEGAGFANVHVAYDGPAALEMIGKEKYDVVVSDYDIPGVSGAELYDAVAAKVYGGNATRFVLMTGLREAELPKALLQKASRIFYKPFDMQDLISSLQQGEIDKAS